MPTGKVSPVIQTVAYKMALTAMQNLVAMRKRVHSVKLQGRTFAVSYRWTSVRGANNGCHAQADSQSSKTAQRLHLADQAWVFYQLKE